ncbi:MAG TPA: response regulator transcription factor [Patescibacteria group bacterium]|jgi:DNA-binding response OmpR family regulator|nr:response regulator transcription factor [Patescibacteria group bacterium]
MAGVEMAVTRVLLVDDDVELAELVGEYLTREGFTLDAETDGTHALDRAVSGDYQLTVLDVMLPGISGFDLLRGIRATSQMPVLMLTARGDDVDRIVGLELGADDYLSKPFNPRELVARIRAILRRTQTEAHTPGERAAETLGLDDVAMDLGRRTVRRAGAPVELTAVEFTLLELLLRGAGAVVRRDELARGALGRALLPFDRSIDVHVSRLRKKLGPRPGGGERIATLRAVGYLYTC